jgi:hypothetical protein
VYAPNWLPLLIGRWFEVDFDTAREWMRNHPREYINVAAWARANPQTALEDALASPELPRSCNLLVEAVKQLAGPGCGRSVSSDTNAAAGPPRTYALTIAANILTITDPAAAFAAYEPGPSEFSNQRTWMRIFNQWAKRDPEAALEQMENDASDAKGRLCSEMISSPNWPPELREGPASRPQLAKRYSRGVSEFRRRSARLGFGQPPSPLLLLIGVWLMASMWPRG